MAYVNQSRHVMLNAQAKTLLENYTDNIGAINKGRHGLYREGRQYSTNENILTVDEFHTNMREAFKSNGYAGFLGYVNEFVGSLRQLINLYNKSSQKDIVRAGKPGGLEPKVSDYNDQTSYDRSFSSAEGFPGDLPSQEDIKSASKERFNIGQVLGQDFGKGSNARRNYLNSSDLSYITRGIGRGILTFTDFVNATSAGNVDAILSRSFSPSFNRPPDPKPRKYDLATLLEQNLLLPAQGKSNADVYRETYLENRGKSNEFKEGTMGGVPIEDIQEPDNSGNKAFSFEDQATYLNSDKMDRGFTNNINVNSDKANPAIVQSNPESFASFIRLAQAGVLEGLIEQAGGNVAEAVAGGESFGHAENQFFPFMFETLNRGGGGDFKQYAFFQAAINQLQESFQPTWSSKSFFGRTEKIHTYTETDRVIDLQFVVFAASMRELQNLYERTVWLAQQTYGSFDIDSENNISRLKSGPLLQVTIGDLFSRAPGFIRNLSYNWDFGGAGGKWELTKGLRTPVILQVSMSYQIIHAALPDRNFDFYWGMQSGIRNGDRPLIPTTSRGTEGQPDEQFIDLMGRIG
jgi:hypothetical protein